MLIIFLSSASIVLIALLGNLVIRRFGHSHEIIMRLVGFSSGALLGGVFFNLLPEMIAEGLQKHSFPLILVTIVGYLILEKFLFWRHSHDDCLDCPPDHRHAGQKSIGYINLIGDSIHNFIDGVIIAGAYGINFQFGLVTTLAVALHEIPQEISDLGVLLFSGFKFKKAILFNVIAASSVVFGAFFGQYFILKLPQALTFLLPVAVGGFLYIAVSDMLPILRGEHDKKEFSINFAFLILGILFIMIAGFFE